jgi:hypothetical protein
MNLFRKMQKVGAGETAATCQPSHKLIVDLIVTTAVKTKKPTESWAWMLLLAERVTA